MQDDLTAKQNDYAVFLPAISGFYATFIGKQRDPVNGPYVDPARFPQGLTDMEQLNWLNSQKSLFPYKWSLYSGGHANLDLTKQDWSEDMVRNRDPNTLVLGDSGGFQIAKGLWEGDWKANSGCPKAQARREAVVKWLDGIADYGMTLDIPTWVIHDKNASKKCGIRTLPEAVEATKFNNEFYMKHRKGVKNGGMKVLNVLQGANHPDADRWYEIMKEYCDPAKYPDTHFNGWAMGGQNMCDVHLILRRLVTLRYDNLLQEGVHDWMHFLGTSKLEWAVLLTVIQRAVRKYVNPSFTISFDCASPFLATANGQVYFENVFPNNGKWSYRMAPVLDDKKYAKDTRKWSDGLLADLPLVQPNTPIKNWQNSPISDMLKMKDICFYAPGDLNKNGKEPEKTSWDSFSYALLMGHNVWMHLTAVQEANRRFDGGEHPAMMRCSGPRGEYFEDIVEAIFAAPDKATAMEIIEMYGGPLGYWTEIIGTRGFKGKKAFNGNAMFDVLFEVEGELEAVEEEPEEEFDESKLEHLGE
jgi:hypothetical protein